MLFSGLTIAGVFSTFSTFYFFFSFVAARVFIVQAILQVLCIYFHFLLVAAIELLSDFHGQRVLRVLV